MIIKLFDNISFHYNFSLSWLIVPLFAFLYYQFPNVRSIVFNTIICISLIGLINIRSERMDNKTYEPQSWQHNLTVIFHGILLLILIDFNKYGYFNLGSLILLLFELLFIRFMPWWPYYKSNKNEFIIQIVSINLILYSLHYLFTFIPIPL